MLRIAYTREEVIQRDGHEFYDGEDGSGYGSVNGMWSVSDGASNGTRRSSIRTEDFPTYELEEKFLAGVLWNVKFKDLS